jgi:hypothetical protein
MEDRTADSFIMVSVMLVDGGTSVRRICGATTCRIALIGDMPMARALSNWPRGNARIAARTISA